MHCPRCGQQQIAEDTKFCSRCGFQLSIVTELLANGGVLPQLAALQKRSFFSRKNGVIFSAAWFIFFTMFLTSIWGILGVEELAAICAVTGVFGAMLFVIASLVLLPSSKRNFGLHNAYLPQSQATPLYGSQAGPALPPQRQQPASEYSAPVGSWRAPDTGDLAKPGSVVEGTTKLLTRDDQ